MTGWVVSTYPSGWKPSGAREVAVLEDPDERAEARDDRQRVHDQRLGRQHDRAKEHEQDEVGRDDDEQQRPREVGRDPVDHVGDVGGAATHQHGHPGRRREARRRVAQSGDQGLALVAVRAVRRVQGERGQVALRRGRQGRRHVPVARAVRVAVQQGVLVQGQPRVDVDQAVDAAHARIGREPARVVVQLGQVRLRGRRRHRSGSPGRSGRTRPRRTRAAVGRTRRATARSAAGSRRPGR